MYNVKITVERMPVFKDLADKYATPMGAECAAHKVGQVFISKEYGMPEGLCPWAWVDIQRDAAVLASGGNYPWVKQKGLQFSCCTAGITPVIFRLERIEEKKEKKTKK